MTAAKQAAESRTYNGIDGHLFTITTPSENDFVAELHPSDLRPWIGLSDETTEGYFKWVTGDPFDYSNWDSKQPDNHLYVSHGNWRNVSCVDEGCVEFLG